MTTLKDTVKLLIKESIYFPEQESLPSEPLADFIKSSFNTVNQLHIFHLLTNNAQQHTVLGELYENLQELIDEIAEEYIALGGMGLEGMHSSVVSYAVDVSIIETFITQFCIKIDALIIETSNDASMESIKHKLVKIQALVNKSKYLLGLN